MPTGQPFTLDVWLPLRKTKAGAALHVRVHTTFRIPAAIPGGPRIPLPPRFQIGLAWDFKKKDAPIDLDASIIGLDSDEQLVDMVSYKKLVGFGGAVRLRPSLSDCRPAGASDQE